jgi:putative ABC transport system ATP-binding protein
VISVWHRGPPTVPAAMGDQEARASAPVRPADAALVELRGIGRSFSSDPPVIALRDVDLTLHRGRSAAIVGPSGSGKSTLMNILGCLDRSTTGTYRFDGIEVDRLDDDQRAVLRAERIGFVFQTFNLLAHRTVLENVMLAEVYRGARRDGRSDRALAALEQVGMTRRASFLPPRLSGGEQQRVAIARALMGDHTLLLCDEPTGNLDSVNTDSVLALFDELSAAGLTIVIVTHEEHVAQHADRIVRVLDGHVIEEQG